VEPREDQKREPLAQEVRQEQPRRERFRIVKLEERIAPQAAAYQPTTSLRPAYCIKSY
jgi:hypothetical protein